MQLTPTDLAQKYFVDDLTGASMPGARLHGILLRIEMGDAPNPHALNFLIDKGLVSLHSLVTGRITPLEFHRQAAMEKDARTIAALEHAATNALDLERQTAERDAAIKARFEEMENDPVLRRRREAKQLRDRFGLGFIEPEMYPRVMRALTQIAEGRRLSPEDVIWLSTEAEDCWTSEIQSCHHRLEAAALTRDWERTGNAWTAVNACAHWRKGERPEEALELTAKLLELSDLSPKLQSAIRTTRGGAKRDLGHLAEARDLGHEAQRLSPKDFRPCTLLGAIYMQLGNFISGHDWYEKAEAFGAKRDFVDQDIRSVLARCAPDARKALSDFLLSRDAERFAWVGKQSAGRKT